MTRLATEGFELGDTLALNSANNVDITTTFQRTGTYAIKIDGLNNSYWEIVYTASSEVYAFVGYLNDNLYRANIIDLLSGGTSIARIYNDGTMYPSLYLEGSLIGTGAVQIPEHTWTMFELHLKIDDAPNGIITAKYNGAIFASYTGDTKYSASTVNRIRGARTYEGSHYWDDIAVNDANGLVDNSWVGDCRVEYHPANDNGDESDWNGSDGDKVDNYDMVNDIPQNGDVNYVYSTTPGDQDIYKVTDFSGAGKIINRIWPECRAKDAQNAGGQIKIGHKNDGTVYLGSAQSLLGSYGCIKGDAPTVNPFDSGAWEDADIDAIQFVAECE